MTMADATHIEWTDATWNPITGCSVVSPGCTHCYAMQLAGTRLQHHPSRKGLTVDSKAGPVWNGQVRFNAEWLDQPLRWKRPRKIFVCAHGDLFHESVPDAWIDQVFAVMALCPQHVFQVLTKRPERMRAYLSRPAGGGKPDVLNHLAFHATAQVMNVWFPAWKSEGISGAHRLRAIEAFAKWPLPNVWLGVSAEDQTRADERIPILLDTPAAIRWVSLEPLLGPVDLYSTKGGTLWMGGQRGCGGLHNGNGTPECPRHLHHHHDEKCKPGLDWVVLGGESGPGARPMHPDWARQVRDDCAAAGVPFLFKQWGAWSPCDAWLPGRHKMLAIQPDGRMVPDDVAPQDVGGQRFVWLTKKAAGRRLDGQLHDGYPPTHSSPLGGGGPSPQAMVEGVIHPASNGAPDHG
jgi:protein gp37